MRGRLLVILGISLFVLSCGGEAPRSPTSPSGQPQYSPAPVCQSALVPIPGQWVKTSQVGSDMTGGQTNYMGQAASPISGVWTVTIHWQEPAAETDGTVLLWTGEAYDSLNTVLARAVRTSATSAAACWDSRGGQQTVVRVALLKGGPQRVTVIFTYPAV